MKLVLLAHVKETIRLVMCPEIYPSLSLVLRRADFPARHRPGPYRPTGRSQQRRLGTDPDLLNYGQQTYFKASNTGAVNTFGSSVATSVHTVVVPLMKTATPPRSMGSRDEQFRGQLRRGLHLPGHTHLHRRAFQLLVLAVRQKAGQRRHHRRIRLGQLLP